MEAGLAEPFIPLAYRRIGAEDASASAVMVTVLATAALIAFGVASALQLARLTSSSVLEPAAVDSESAAASLRVASRRDMRLPLSVTVSRDDWGLDDLSRLRFGQLSLVQGDEPRLLAYRLSERSVPGFPDRVSSQRPEAEGNTFVVADFTSGNRNRLGGFFGPYSRAPSRASGRLSRSPDGRRSLAIDFNRDPGGFCGLWVHLFDLGVPPAKRRYLDARAFSTLSFWIRGERGGERVLLKLADAEWERHEDALAVGEVAEYMATGRVEQGWQRAEVPLHRLPDRLDASTLASVILEALSEGTSRVYVSRLAFSLAAEPLPELPNDIAPDSLLRRAEKATWIWNTAELLDDGAKRSDLLDFLEAEGFTRVFLQIPTPEDVPHPAAGLEIDRSRLLPLVEALRHAGLRVYALDGFAGYALPRYHAGVLHTIDEVVAYNRSVPEQARFYGIRHDIEPYLLPGFHGPRRERILGGLLELTAESARRSKAGGLVYGVDIPFWYDAPDENTHELVTVEFGGVRRPVSHHIIELVDDVAIMDYRTEAYGADGTIRHAEGELAYAAERGKPVLIGLETSELPDEELFEFRGEPEVGAFRRPAGRDHVILEPRGDSVKVWLVRASESGRTAAPLWPATPDSVLYRWPVYRRTEVPAAKLSFATLGRAALAAVVEETAREYGRVASFAGFAFHHAGSYRALLHSDSAAGPGP